MHRPAPRALLLALALPILGGCFDKEGVQKVQQTFTGGLRPDELPVMTNRELPFRYPQALYAQRAQGNVTLRLFIDEQGQVLPESTQVEETSGYPALDSAAVTGSQELTFVPAKRGGEPMAVSILFPVFYRHPEAPALPGDTVLQRRGPSPAPAAPAGSRNP